MIVSVFDSPDPAGVAAKASQLFDDGVRGVILYISPGNPAGSKTVKKLQIDAIHAAGIAVSFVCEWWGGSNNFSHHDINAAYGARDGAFCGRYLKTLGVPARVCVSPTVDNDVSATTLTQLCLPYFRAFRAALNSDYQMGGYGCGALLFALELDNVDAGTSGMVSPRSIMDVSWLSNAMGWSRSHEYAATQRAIITQLPQSKLLGIDIDPDVVRGDLATAGFWMPPKTVPQEIVAEPIAQTSLPARQVNITATCFGGAGDNEASAYGGLVDPSKPGVALPFRFPNPRPKVTVIRAGKSAVCEIVDVGPHNINDPYWTKAARPLAESQGGNHAGIDMTPAVFAALGIGPHDPAYGLTRVDWEFVEASS